MNANDPVLNKMGVFVERWKTANDSRYVFLSCYSMMSSNMIVALEKNEFYDSKWVGKLLHRFADYYFDSLSCYECGDVTPSVWLSAHQACKKKEFSELQLLVLGVNAHINYDLVLALYDVLQPEWEFLSKKKRKERYEDHCHVNDVIAQTIDRVQDEILEPSNAALDWIDKLMGRMDEYLISRLISKWREDVWENSQKLLAMPMLEDRVCFTKEIEKEVLRISKTISYF